MSSKGYEPVEIDQENDEELPCRTREGKGLNTGTSWEGSRSSDDENASSSSIDEFTDEDDHEAPLHISDGDTGNSGSVAVLGIAASLGFCATYFWRYPVFMLPPDILATPVVILSGRQLDLQACFSVAYIGGFGSAKIGGMRFVASQFFFRNRLAVICAMAVFTMAVECGGVWVFAAHPPLQVLSVFVSSFVQSWMYGAVLTYLEGRESTETLLAIMGGTFILAGGASRGAATLVLGLGVPPLLMPLTLGLIMCPFCCICLWISDRQPKPSAADLASRSERQPITPAEQRAFLTTHAVGMAAVYGAYAILTGVRSFRDFYAKQIFAAALGDDSPPAWVFFVADLPGGIISSLVLYSFRTNHNHLSALRSMLLACSGGGALILAATLVFLMKITGGLLWQIILGIGLYVAYSILSSAASERIIAATGTKGTCTFLVFLGDCFGYVVTICILLVRDFAPRGDDDGDGNVDAVLRVFLILVVPGMATAVLSLLAARYYFGKRLGGQDIGAAELNTFTEPIDEPSSAFEAFELEGESDHSIT